MRFTFDSTIDLGWLLMELRGRRVTITTVHSTTTGLIDGVAGNAKPRVYLTGGGCRSVGIELAAIVNVTVTPTEVQTKPRTDAPPDDACTRKGCGRPLSEHEMGGVFCP